MGTRSKIILASKTENKTLTLYKHWDGYPTGNLNMLHRALREKTLGAIVAECEQFYERTGMVEHETTYTKTPFYSDDYGLQGDLEWIYIVDIDSKSVEVYGDDYGDERELYAKGVVNPLIYVVHLRQDCQAQEKADIMESIQKLSNIGFSVNQGSDSKEIKDEEIEELSKYQEKISKLEGKILDLEMQDQRKNESSRLVFSKVFSFLGTKEVKAILKAAKLDIEKVTKCKAPGTFNVYLKTRTNEHWQKLQLIKKQTGLNLELMN